MCPFCQQETITDDFRQKLESFFDTNYKRKVDRMNMLLDEYRTFAKQIITAIEIAIQDNDDSISTSKLDINILKVSQFFGLWNLLQGHDFPVKPLISSYE